MKFNYKRAIAAFLFIILLDLVLKAVGALISNAPLTEIYQDYTLRTQAFVLSVAVIAGISAGRKQPA